MLVCLSESCRCAERAAASVLRGRPARPSAQRRANNAPAAAGTWTQSQLKNVHANGQSVPPPAPPPCSRQILTRLHTDFQYLRSVFNLITLLFRVPSTQRGEPVTSKYAIQTLAACTAASRLAREELLKSDKSKGLISTRAELHPPPSSLNI